MQKSEKVSVLFVDDEPNLLEAIRRLLIDEPYEVRTCTDPRQALQEVIADAPAVLVSDFYMPEMNGPALLHKVREIDSSIVRVILTGKPDVTAVLDAVQEGSVYRFILKPWDEDELKMTVSQAIGYRRLLLERNRLLGRVHEQQQTIETLEQRHPGLTKAPAKDGSGAIVLTADDLPKGTS